MIEINAATEQEMYDAFTERSKELKHELVLSVIDVLEGNRKEADFVTIMPLGVSLKIKSEDYYKALEKNKDILVEYEEYELAAKVVDFLRKKNDV